jgi:hypothetical protein
MLADFIMMIISVDCLLFCISAPSISGFILDKFGF